LGIGHGRSGRQLFLFRHLDARHLAHPKLARHLPYLCSGSGIRPPQVRRRPAPDDLTSLFEELSGAVLFEPHCVFEAATSGMRFRIQAVLCAPGHRHFRRIVPLFTVAIPVPFALAR
jgi:hypothetical protein